MKDVRGSELKVALDAMTEGATSIHISGEPGVGKTVFLTRLLEELPETYESLIVNAYENYDTTALTQELLYEMHDAVGAISSLIQKLTGGSIGLGPVSIGASVEDDRRHLQKLGELSKKYPKTRHFVICIDDVHNLAGNGHDTVRGFLNELSEKLAPNVHLITAGQMTYEGADHVVELGMFSQEETEIVLRNQFPNIDQDTVRDVHEELEGHPYYIGLLRESTESEGVLTLSEEEYRTSIEEKYLRWLSTEEEKFLRRSAPLVELEETICSEVFGYSQTEVRRLTESLSEKVVVRELGRSEESGEKVYKVHDLFRGFLYERIKNPEEVHREVFQHYADQLLEDVRDSQAPPVEGITNGSFASIHLSQMFDDEPEVQDIQSEIDKLDYNLWDRLKFVLGFFPYIGNDDWPTDEFLIGEFDGFRETWGQIDPDDDVDERISHEIGLIFLDLFRAQLRVMSDTEFDESGEQILEHNIDRVHDPELIRLIEGQEGEMFARFFPDFFEVINRTIIVIETDDDGLETRNLNEIYSIFEEYGLERPVLERFVRECRKLSEDIDPGEQIEDFVEEQVEDALNDIDDSGVTRVTLLRLQTKVIDEIGEWTNSFAAVVLADSDRFNDFLEESGLILEEAENPFFAAAWYSRWAGFFEWIAPDSPIVTKLKSSFEVQAERRREYEETLDEPIAEIDEMEPTPLELPDMFQDGSE